MLYRSKLKRGKVVRQYIDECGGGWSVFRRIIQVQDTLRNNLYCHNIERHHGAEVSASVSLEDSMFLENKGIPVRRFSF